MNGELDSATLLHNSGTVRIKQSRALSYRVRAGAGGSSTNYVVELTVETDQGDVIGYGEGHPRWNLSGDNAGSSWKMLTEAVRRLEGRELTVADAQASVQGIRRVMDEMRGLARERSVDENHTRPFRGTLLGIETALLDVVARSRGETLAALLGKRRDAAPHVSRIAAGHVPTMNDDSLGVVTRDARFMVTFRGREERLNAKAVLNRLLAASQGPAERTVWIDAGASLSDKSSEDLVRDVIEAFSGQRLEQTVLINQPFQARGPERLHKLQRFIDEQLRDNAALNVQVLADYDAWDTDALREVQAQGRLGGIRIRPARAGGLLAAADLAQVATASGVHVCLSGMGEESRLAASALHQLALALETVSAVDAQATVEQELPLTEFSGESNALNVEEPRTRTDSRSDALFSEDPEEADFAEEQDEFEEEGDLDTLDLKGPYQDLSVAQMEKSNSPGIGVDVSFIALVNDVEKMETFPEPPLPEFEGMSPNIFDDIEDLHPLGARGSKGHLLEREALALGLSTRRYSKGVFLAADGVHEPVNFKWNRNPLVSGVALGLCTHKEATRLQLQRAGVPVPQGRTFERGDLTSARAFAERIGYPVVMKPAMGVRGIGVVANIQNEQELIDAYELMTSSRLGDQDFIVEKHINGKDYRIVVVGNQVVAAILREPASVLGDGKHTVAELLLNRNSARRRNPHLWARPPQYNAAAKYELQKQGLTINSIPSPGQTVRLGSTNSLSQGGESIAVLDEMHPSILEACLKVVRSVPGMDYCGVDFLLEDHTKALDEQDAGICELNAHAAIGNCQYPMFGPPRPVARIVMYEVARRHGLKVPSAPAEEVSLRVIIRGKVTGVGYRQWLRRRALEAGVNGWVRNLDSKRVEAVLSGPTNATTAIVSSLINGPRRARPTSYVAEHVHVPDAVGFEIRPSRTAVELFRTKARHKIRRIWETTSGR